MAQLPALSGTVVSSSKEPLPGASVVLLRASDSLRVAAQSTTADGGFSFNGIKADHYLLKVTMTGFVTRLAGPIEVNSVVKYPALVLTESRELLKELTLTANLPGLQQKSDRLVVDVERLNTTGDNALDVVKKAPGVRLDKDDLILFRNNGSVLVLIDGRRTYMSPAELSNYLKSLPGNTIRKLELIPNPPANYDAEGVAGVINIVMKRNPIQGWNGSASSTLAYGRYGKASGGLNLNYHSGKVSAYVRSNAGYSDSYNELKLGRKIGDEWYHQRNYWHPKSSSWGYTAGADVFLTPKHTLGVLFRGSNSPQDAQVNSTSIVTNASGQATGGVDMLKPQHSTADSYAANMNYAFEIDTAGQKLTFDGDYVRGIGTSVESFTNSYFDASGKVIGDVVSLRSNTPSQSTIRSLKMDYVLPVAGGWRAESGWKASWVETDNDSRFDSLKTAGWIADPRRTNHFVYAENIWAGYLTLNKTLGKKWEFKAGVRAEQTRSDARSQNVVPSAVARHYWIVVPSFFVTYRVNDDHQLNASFSRRVGRPGYKNLDPFTFYSDPYTAIRGNSYLQPSFSRSFLFNYTYKSFQLLSLSYLAVNRAINSVIEQNDVTKESISQPQNIGRSRSWSATSSGMVMVARWWSVSAEVDAAYDRVFSGSSVLPYRAERFSWSGSTDQTFTLPAQVKIQLTGQYYSPSVSGLARTLSGSQIDAGVTKTFGAKKATLSLKVRDVFFGNRYRSVLRYNNVYTTWQNEWESRRVSLGMSYFFGNAKVKAARNRSTGAVAEQNRL